MLRFLSVSSRRARLHLAAVVATTAIIGLSSRPGDSQAQPPSSVLRVEEDWEVVLNEPGTQVDAPQLHTVMTPFGNLDSFFTQNTWNYRELPSFVAGGVQLQAWNGDSFLFQKSVNATKMSTISETVSWTQSLETDGTVLTFQISNGQSTTWGTFGGGNNFRLQGNANLPNLNGYDTDVSEENSAITYGANRVQTLKITEVRRYGATGLISTDSTDRVIFDLSQL